MAGDHCQHETLSIVLISPASAGFYPNRIGKQIILDGIGDKQIILVALGTSKWKRQLFEKKKALAQTKKPLAIKYKKTVGTLDGIGGTQGYIEWYSPKLAILESRKVGGN